ncbi:MAG TPA: phage tail protein [Bryobacteraceae bacterium]|nr:phage tail protein [Bryobacteraceae bacterium]
MATIDQLKEQEVAPTPLFLFDCLLSNGNTERWSTHAVTFNLNAYGARLLKHNLFELQASSQDGLDGATKVAITLANADSHFSQIERETGFRGAQVTVQFLFYDLVANQAASESRVVFRGTGNTADEITESALRVTFTNRLSLQRIMLPDVQIERRCPWRFPSTAAQRQEALNGGAQGGYSALFKCGYSADQTGGAGNLNAGAVFTDCDFTRANCTARGMFSTDQSNNATRRFGGIEFVPAQIAVRGFGEPGWHVSPVIDNLAAYNDYVPIVYGTAWYQPPIVFSRNDGNLTRMEVLLGVGEISAVVSVVVNNVQIPAGVSGADMTATGWYNVVSAGTRNGAFNMDFTDGSGNPFGDPYGSMAYLSVVTPNRISNGQSLATVQVLLQGLMLEQFDANGTSLGASFTNNPAWVLLDVLRRTGWLTTDVDLPSFAAAAAYSAAAIQTTDLYGNTVSTPRYQCNLVIQTRTSAAEIVRGIRNGAFLILTYGSGGLLTLRAESTLAVQQPTLPDGSNSTSALDGGWPVYEFSDATAAFSGILRNADASPAIRLYSRSGADVPNRLTVEFQDEFNEYQQDSLSLVDTDDAALTGREVTAAFAALGLPNFDQATRMLDLQLAKTIVGNVFVEFETTVRGIGLTPGDLLTLTYLKEGLERQLFRVVKLAPGANYQTVLVTAQWHDDAWYPSGGASAAGGRRPVGSSVGLPRPLVGTVVDGNGLEEFGVTETVIPVAGGGSSVELAAAFTVPSKPSSTGANIPLLSLNPTIATTGGALAGGQTLYYAVSALDGAGGESGLSFVVTAAIPAGTNTNAVTLSGLSFSPGSTGFVVYRGTNPVELLRIASQSSVAVSFTDSGGAPAQLVGPPDESYDHANFYWRMELQPETQTGLYSATTIGNANLGALPDDFKGALVRVTRGKGAGQERPVVTNNATTLTVTPAWVVEPDSSSYFTVAESTWTLAGVALSSPAEIDVPNRPGATVQISGRSANVFDQESAYELNPLTRWQIGGAAGPGVDQDTPPAPVFGLSLSGQGSIELAAIGFTDITNTHTISAGTLTLFYWDELASPTSYSLASAIAATDTSVTLNSAGPGQVGDLIQMEAEMLQITGVTGAQYTVTRASQGSTAAAHIAGTLVYHLKRNTSIIPFVPGFFGSPASGNFSYSVFLPDVRVGAADLFMTNAIGGGLTAPASYGATVDQGLRTLSGGQFSIQIEGYLATQTGAAPPLMVEAAHAVRDVFAVVSQAPSGSAVTLQLRQGSTVYCTLTIAAGATQSNVVGGFGLTPLTSGSQLNLDVLTVPTAANSLPGSDLTVTIRL